MDLYELIIQELEARGCAYVRDFAPFYICSAGAHIFNLMNKRRYVYVEAGRVVDTRVHILFVAPPGFSKTYWLEQFLRGEQAIFYNSGIDIGFEGTLTEAGFVGTVRFVDHEPITVPGAALIYSKAILGIEEFSGLTEIMKQQYARTLDVALLGALDSGYCYKRLAAGELKYQTNVTLQTGVQPARYDLTSGLGRRFFFLQFIPTMKDFQRLKIARRKAKGKRYNPIRTDRIRRGVRQLIQKLEQIDDITFDEVVFRLFDDLGMVHYEEPLFERLLIGYTVMKGRVGKTLKITLDKESERLVIDGYNFRRQIRRGAEFAEVIALLVDGPMSVVELKERLLLFGMDWDQATQLIYDMHRLHLIHTDGATVKLHPTVLESVKHEYECRGSTSNGA